MLPKMVFGPLEVKIGCLFCFVYFVSLMREDLRKSKASDGIFSTAHKLFARKAV